MVDSYKRMRIEVLYERIRTALSVALRELEGLTGVTGLFVRIRSRTENDSLVEIIDPWFLWFRRSCVRVRIIDDANVRLTIYAKQFASREVRFALTSVIRYALMPSEVKIETDFR